MILFCGVRDRKKRPRFRIKIFSVFFWLFLAVNSEYSQGQSDIQIPDQVPNQNLDLKDKNQKPEPVPPTGVKAAPQLNPEGYVPNPDPAINALPYCDDLRPKTEKKEPGKKTNLRLPEVMIPTAYDDADACPGGCKEPHAVFHHDINGTPFAHLPGSKDRKCEAGKSCEICFRSGRECMTIKYAGAGPPFGIFDFSLSFYKTNCEKSDLLPVLKKKCDQYKTGAEKYQKRINCIANKGHPSCIVLMRRADEAWEQDEQEFLKCKKEGQDVYNNGKSALDQRYVRCGYTKLKYIFQTAYQKQPCKRPWHMLKPGACRKGTYPGPKGLDCCSSDPFDIAAMGSDCDIYYPEAGSPESSSSSFAR